MIDVTGHILSSRYHWSAVMMALRLANLDRFDDFFGCKFGILL